MHILIKLLFCELIIYKIKVQELVKMGGCISTNDRSLKNTLDPRKKKKSKIRQGEGEGERKRSKSKTQRSKLDYAGMRSEIRKTTGTFETEGIVTAQVIFGADMKQKPFNKSTKFKPAGSFVNLEDTVKIVRNQDYCQEIKKEIGKPEGSEKKDILNYDLDVEDGICKTPVVNTFQYKTVLKHNIGSVWNDKFSKIK